MRRRCLPVIVPALVAMALPSAAGAQAAEPVRSGSGMTWEGEGLQAGFCIHFLVDPAMAEALGQLADDPARKEAMGRAALAAVQDLTPPKVFARLEKLYDDVLAGAELRL